MPSEVILPRVDMDMATGRIAKWLVESGAPVTKGQPLFEIETDKAAMEIEAPSTGIIRDMAAASDAAIPVGSVVAWIDAPGEAPAPGPTTPAQVVPSVTPAAVPEPAAAPPLAPPPLPAGPPVSAGGPGRPRATPIARRLARDHGVDLGALTGSGPRGRIQAQDVTTAAAARPRVGRQPVQVAPGDPPTRLERSGPGDPGPNARAEQPNATIAAALPAFLAAATPGALRCLRDGPGTPLLLVHGFAGDAQGWRPFLSGRGGERAIYAVDLPGHGQSPADATTLPALADALETALADAGLRVDLVGHSLGAAVAAAVAARGTVDIRSVLLLAPAGLGPAIDTAVLDGLLSAASEASLTPWMQALVADPATITPAFVRATLRLRDGTTLVARQRAMLASLFADRTQTFSIRPDLARLAVPTRVVVGAEDAVIPAEQARGLPPLVALHRLAGVGHMPQIEARETVWAIIDQMAG